MSGYGQQKRGNLGEDKFAIPPTYVVHGKGKGSANSSGSAVGVSKGNTNSNAAVSQVSRKLDAEDGDVPQIKHVTHDVKVTIQNGRKNKGWSQKELAHKMNVQASAVQAWESGKGLPPQGRDRTKIQNLLGVKLPKS